MTAILPRACIEEIERLQRKFIWGDTQNTRKYHAIGWETITKPKSHGGLGLRRLAEMNKACIFKLVWKLQNGVNELWCQILFGKYQRGIGNDNVVAKGTDSSLWKEIVKAWPKLLEASFWSIRDGRSVDLCNHKWIDEDTRLIDMSIDIPVQFRNAKVKDLVDDYGAWNWSDFQNWLPEQLMLKIAAIPPPDIDAGDDKRLLKGAREGEIFHLDDDSWKNFNK
ncbi:hypothetical protein L195_g055006 [Trifolium pratense]|uniref:Uncharacterized protein n=1 Tax=Trifolium pratense TaxID=57577 RepID=A0A2K3KJ29_TRIPR|nr:hypothetical protein L195_g055006 [Trifolium pratense]